MDQDFRIQVAILAPTPALRSGLRAMLAADEHVEVLAEVDALVSLAPSELDVLLLATDDVAGDALRSWLEGEDEPPAMLLLSDDTQAARSLASLPLRAWGILTSDAGEDELLAAIGALHQGLVTLSPELAPLLLTNQLPAAEDGELVEPLSERENEVLQLLALGLANKQMALELGISEHTVKFHVSSIYAKLGVTNRTEAVRRGARLGLIVL